MKQLLILVILALGTMLSAQETSKWRKLDASYMDAIMYPTKAAWRNYLSGEERTIQPKVKVLYSRPLKKDREIFGKLVPFGKEWRFGANEATTVTFYQSVALGETTIPAGTYTAFADINPDSWTIKLSTENTGLAGNENRDMSKDIASLKVPTQKLNKSIEAFSMTFQEIDDMTCHWVIAWDQTQVAVPIKFNPIEFEELAKSPMDMAHFPAKSNYANYLEGEERNLKPLVQVQYGRPYKNGRNVFGDLIKTGDTWRLGANQSTEIVFYQDTYYGGTEVKKGRYAMYAKINDGSWDLILSKDYPAWGVENRDITKDKYTIKVPVTKESEIVENLTIIFDEKPDGKSADMIIGWDTTRATVSVMVK